MTMEANRIKTNRISVVHIGHIRDTESLDEYYRLVSEGKMLVSEDRVLVTRK